MLSDHRKISISNQEHWSHHRSGWPYVLNYLTKYLHIDGGTEFIGYLDGHFRGNPDGKFIIKNKWVGVLHNTPNSPEFIRQRHPRIYDLKSFANSKDWRNNKSTCAGIIVFSDYSANHLRNQIDADVVKLIHPTKESDINFDFNSFVKSGKILHLGHWLRNYEAFIDIKSSRSKILIKPFENLDIPHNNNIKVLEHVSNDEYDKLLSENIVFLNLYDSSVNNVVLECIERSTPIVINRLPPLEEYLGVDYPLFYDTIDEAEYLLHDMDQIKLANKYLSELEIRSKLSIYYFIESIIKSKIYQKL